MQTISAINFNTANQTLRQLLGNGLTYRVPRFQRDYSWTVEEWEDLWQDILNILPDGDEPAHYMGYLVMQKVDSRDFEVIDGQQRITTLSLLILAILNNIQALIDDGIDSENNQRRLDQLRNTYIGYLDPATLVPRSKLMLNRNDDAYYQNYLVPLESLPNRNLKASERLLRKAFEWFDTAVQKAYVQKPDGATYAKLIEHFVDKLFFTVITVTDELNAFKVFETLNARGVRLSSTDLLKNYLFSIIYRAHAQQNVHEREIDALEQRWQRIIDQLGSEKFPNFLRVHWNSRHNLVRHTDLFKTIRRHVQNREDAFLLLREMEEDIEIYAALLQPEDQLWNTQRDQRKYLTELRLLNVKQPYALLLAAKRALSNPDFTTILRACTVISFRYNTIGGLASNDQERAYNTTARELAQGKLKSRRDILQALRPIYLSNDRFRNLFEDKEIRTTGRNSRLVRYILFKLESYVTTKDYDFESKRYTIEHILPENAEDGWDQFTDLEKEQFVYRLGNMTLLQADSNRALGNKPFDQKQKAFGESEFEITRLVEKENEEWTVQRIAQRQRWMAKQATTIWQVAQLA